MYLVTSKLLSHTGRHFSQSSISLLTSFPWYCAILKNSTIMSQWPACISLFDVPPQWCALTWFCVCACFKHVRTVSVCVSFPRHTSQGEGKDHSSADSAWLNAPPWTCLNGADCSNEAGQTRQSTCGRGSRERWKRPSWMCQSSSLGDKETLCWG